MYKNTGKKILAMAKTLVIISIIIAVILGVIVGVFLGSAVSDVAGFFAALFIIAIGCTVAWVSNLLLAGFGELVSNTLEILGVLKGIGKMGEFDTEQSKPHVNKELITPQMQQQTQIEAVKSIDDADLESKLQQSRIWSKQKLCWHCGGKINIWTKNCNSCNKNYSECILCGSDIQFHDNKFVCSGCEINYTDHGFSARW